MMGTGLVCNFFKGLGLPYYDKVDVHVNDFLDSITLAKLNEERQFILSWRLASEAGMEPFPWTKFSMWEGNIVRPE
jgi:hypothetical protein